MGNRRPAGQRGAVAESARAAGADHGHHRRRRPALAAGRRRGARRAPRAVRRRHRPRAALAAVTAYWDQRLVGAAERARTCPAVRDDWWARDAQPWPAAASANTCPRHDGRVVCLLSAARRALTAGTLDSERMRQRCRPSPTTVTPPSPRCGSCVTRTRPPRTRSASCCPPRTASTTCTLACSPTAARGCSWPPGRSWCRRTCARSSAVSAPPRSCARARTTTRSCPCSTGTSPGPVTRCPRRSRRRPDRRRSGPSCSLSRTRWLAASSSSPCTRRTTGRPPRTCSAPPTAPRPGRAG
jgi:hypothetical protein